ncbi:hypothetical protein ES705_15608 [subsurface metagenome]
MSNQKSISFQGINSTVTSGKIAWKIGISDFLKGIVSGEYVYGKSIKDVRDTIQKIRKSEKGSPDYNKYKKTLPGVCVQGYFDGKRQKKFLTGFTNVVAVDIDKINDVHKIKTWIIEQLGKYSFAIAHSPGYQGLHVYLYAEIKNEADIATVLKNVQKIIGVKIDIMTKDCTRFFNCTWDPDAFINESPDLYEFTPSAEKNDLLGEKQSSPGSEYFDIETLLIEKKLFGKVRYTDNVIWKAFCLLAKRFPQAYIEKYISDANCRKKIFHPESNTVNDLSKIKTTLSNVYKSIKKWQDDFKNYFKLLNGIYKEITNDLGEKRVLPVNANLFFSEYTKDAIHKIKKYDDFGNIPNNYPGVEGVEFTPVPEGIFNIYHPLKTQPVPGSWDNIKVILEHLASDQVQYIYDYIKLLITNPSQILPILVLISTKRETGKTTFLNLMREIFKPNGIIIGMADFSSRFNSHYANKLIVAIDESKLDKREVEKIKAQSTAEYISCEFKGKDVLHIRNIQHFILTSNNLDFAYFDKQENRFWCFEVPKIKQQIPGLYQMAIKEIPAFIYYLLYDHKQVVPNSQSRAWFPSEIVTEHFRGALYEQTKHSCLYLLNNRCRTFLAEFPGEKEIRFTAEDLHVFYSVKMSITVFREILKNEDWINKYDKETRLQYHMDFLTGLSDENPLSARLSVRNDRRRSLYYVMRSDVIDPEDEKEEESEIPF